MRDILIVEDEEDILRLLSFTVSGPEYSVRLARSGEESLAMVRARRPDLMLVDVSLPGISGREVCQAIKGNPATRAVPVVFLTARTSPEDIRLGLEAGADTYLLKPFDPAPLRATMERLLIRAHGAT